MLLNLLNPTHDQGEVNMGVLFLKRAQAEPGLAGLLARNTHRQNTDTS